MREEAVESGTPVSRGRGCLGKILKLGFWGLLIAITVVVLGFQVENRKGAQAWEEVRQELEAAGETLDFRALAGAPVPDEDNFCALPLLREIGVTVDGDMEKGEPAEKRQRLSDLDYLSEKNTTLPTKGGFGRSYEKAAAVDLAAWADYFRETEHLPMPDPAGAPAADIVEGLKKFDPVFAELASGVSRPHAQFVPSWVDLIGNRSPAELELRHYNPTMTAVKTLTLRAIAAARAGEAETALESLLVGIKLAEAAANDGILIGSLVALTDMAILLNGIWETLDAQVLSAEQLARVQAELEKIEYREMLLRSGRVQLAFSAEMVDWAKKEDPRKLISIMRGLDVSRDERSAGAEIMAELSALFVGIAPEGWFDFNKATLVQWEYEYFVKVLEADSLHAMNARQAELRELVEAAKKSRDPHALLACISMPIFEKMPDRFLYGQTLVNQAIAACAVERYFVDRDAYPRNLDDLVPDYLDQIPLDPMTGDESLNYLRYVDGGRYRLWSVGWDGEDDGGKRILREGEEDKTRFSSRKYGGDWVWNYAP